MNCSDDVLYSKQYYENNFIIGLNIIGLGLNFVYLVFINSSISRLSRLRKDNTLKEDIIFQPPNYSV
jgi:hypothetical protein